MQLIESNKWANFELVTRVYFPIVDSVINISGLCIITDSNISFPNGILFFSTSSRKYYFVMRYTEKIIITLKM
jgi:hypothetical protein